MNQPILPFLPDIALVSLALLVLAFDLGTNLGKKAFHVTWIGLVLLILILFWIPESFRNASFGSYRNTSGTLIWKLLFLVTSLATTLLSRVYFQTGGSFRGALSKPGAFYGLLLLCTFGMFALVSARDLLTFYIGIELATLPLYALSAFQPNDSDSAEAGSKFVMMGGFSSALTLFGMSFIYGATGGLGFDPIAHAVLIDSSHGLLWIGTFFILGGLGFKLAMAPFHMWAPDVYHGSPTPVMAFLSVGSKMAAVAALMALFFGPLDPLRSSLSGFFILGAILSMVMGNFGAMRQTHIRRFVAYSSIAQVGYMLLAFLADSDSARIALQYNLIVYGVTSFGLYFILSIVGRNALEERISLRGLNKTSPALALLLLACMFSLAGIPPLAGFMGKFLLFSGAAAKGHYLLVGIAVANAVVSFYYYMLVVKEAYIHSTESTHPSISLTLGQKITLAFFVVSLLVLGLTPLVLNRLL